MPIRQALRSALRCPLRVLGLGLLLGACSTAPHIVPQPGPEGEIARAQEDYARGRLLDAITRLESFEKTYPGSQYIDDALFLLGKAHQVNKEQILARQSLQRVLDDFPRSPFAEDALFEVAQCWYLSVRGAALDPEPAEEALRSYRIYLGRYPEGKYVEEAHRGEELSLGLLARKDCLNGETYMKLRHYAAARRYFEKSLERWADSPSSALALDGIARSYEREKAGAEARAAYQRLLDHLGDDPSRFARGEALARRASRKVAEASTTGS